jgi:4,5-DOPA dioxygenase extradiol
MSAFMPTDLRMPLLFIGHGSPMNAIEDNDITRAWRRLGEVLPRPKAILCLSAHFTARGSFAVGVRQPETIHDFYGFPKALSDIDYPAPGDPGLARRIQSLLPDGQLSGEWGIDHGAWSVLVHMYPKADVPVVQLSLDLALSPADQVALGKALRPLRDEGVLILGSGNVAHNLGRMNPASLGPTDWAAAFDAAVRDLVLAGDLEGLTRYTSLPGNVRSVPTTEHFVPLLYVMGASYPQEPIEVFNQTYVYGSLSMTSYQIG